MMLAISLSAQNGKTDFLKAESHCSDSLHKLSTNSYLTVEWNDSRYFRYVSEDPLTRRKHRWLCDTKKGTREEISEESYNSFKAKAQSFKTNRDYKKKYTADSLYYMTATGDNLCMGNGEWERLLSRDGELFNSFAIGRNRPGASSQPQNCPSGCWIGKTHSYLAIREDNREVGTLSITNSVDTPRPKTEEYKFPMPGDSKVVKYSAWIADADSASLHQVDLDRFEDQLILMPRFQNIRCNDSSAFLLRLARTRDTLDLVRIDARSRRATTVISEVCKPHLNEQLFDYHLIDGGKKILWWSERDGRGKWYLYDLEGRLLRCVTPIDAVCGRIERIDTAAGTVVFAGYGGIEFENPHYRHYYKARLDGRKPVRHLTPGNGNHKIEFSPDGKMIVDRWSRMDLPGQVAVRNAENGKTVFELESKDISAALEKGFRLPELMKVKAADGVTDLYGVVYLPSDLNPERKYPIISNVYPGPQDDQVPLDFMYDDNGNQVLAELGFIVLNFSHRGSCPTRGRDYYTYGYGNLRDYAIDDDIAIIRQVAEKYPCADLDRVGIYGHSGGGFMAVTALLSHPGFYKVAVGASGNYDNNIYTQWWGETFHGVKKVIREDGSEAFECKIPTTAELAANLQGRLLLITGEIDNNVHPASTMRLADALIRNNKRFDMMVIPRADHGLGNRYYLNLIRYYFVEHLGGEPQDHIDIVKHL